MPQPVHAPQDVEPDPTLVATSSVVCVLGMHRAGTSATTGALSHLGVHLGPPEHMMIARDDNPAGFFEHQALSDLNDAILQRLGGSWHEPPALPPGWEQAAELDDLRARAAAVLAADFRAGTRWGWKDPRTCLTLPFWKSLLPAPRYVLCLRSPVDVARSLQARNGFALAKGLALWMAHMTLAVRHLADAPVLVVAYDDLVEQTEAEVSRLEAFIGPGPGGAAAREAAVRSITDHLRHHRSAPDALFDTQAAWDASAFYAFLRSLADLQREEGIGLGAPATFGDWLALYGQRVREGRDARHDVPQLTARLHTAREAHAEAARAIDDLTGRLRETAEANEGLTVAVEGLRAALADRDEALGASRTDADRLRADLQGAIGEHEQLRTELERLRAEQAAIAEYLQTPAGALKVALRAVLPAPAHGALRRWGLQVFPGLSREPSDGKD